MMEDKEFKSLSDKFQKNALNRVNIIRNENYSLIGTWIRMAINDMKGKETEKLLAKEFNKGMGYLSMEKAEKELSNRGINTDILKKVIKADNEHDTPEMKKLDDEYSKYMGIGSVVKANFKIITKLPKALMSVKKLPSIKP